MQKPGAVAAAEQDNSAGAHPALSTPSAGTAASAAPAPAAGAIRSTTDHEHAVVAAFLARHPEYNRLGHDGVLALASTYLDEQDHEERAGLADEGVPVAPYLFNPYALVMDDEAGVDNYGSDYQ